jgi:hypothetical protein
MISKRLVVIAVCAVMVLATVAHPDLAFAKFKDKYSPLPATPANGVGNDSYPNGRPWQATESDFIEVKHAIAEVKGDTESILHELDNVDTDLLIIKNDLTEIKGTLADIQSGLEGVGSNVSALTNTLAVQVSVPSASDAQRNALNDAPVQVFVQVSRNGAGVTGLTPDAFAYSNSFPLNGAGYCGNACFIAGENGLYALELQGDWVEGSYAGTLNVQFTNSTSAGDVTSTGTSLVTFDIPAAPAP